MRRWTWWDVLQGLGALASISGLSLFREGTSSTSGTILAALIVLGVGTVVVSSVWARRGPLVRVGRSAMIDTGKRLISGAKSEVVMFGGDMSWANDYAESIRAVTNRGKSVRVVFPNSQAPKVLQNARTLTEAGAELIPTGVDSGLRAILVDPQDYRDALLYVANRTLRRGAPPVEAGEHGSEASYHYVANVYDMRRDWLLIRAVTKVYEVLREPSAEAPK